MVSVGIEHDCGCKISYLRDILEILLIWQMGIQRDGGRLDGDTSFLLVLAGICKSATIELLNRLFASKGYTNASPALAAEMIPARWTRESVRVDFPWSTSQW